ncbi:MAG: hypothetical protein Q8835_02770 [Sweet potato little leaf phytoplasma]|nr:hypothetical protein [Sweet potato little leaf phytoplasma]
MHTIKHPNDEDEDGVKWKELTSLRSLTLYGIPKLEYLPKVLQHVTSLQVLQITLCLNLMTLPEWIDNLTSLSSLIIRHCPNLTSLPERMCHLHSLQTVSILYCPILKERCKKDIGEDWPKIAHVPYLDIS